MAEASIPVNPFNPGQVFACMGFLEAADALAGDAEGGFDWSNQGVVHFRLRANGDENPFSVVLDFLAASTVRRFAPPGFTDPLLKKKSAAAVDNEADVAAGDAPDPAVTFPGPQADTMALPVRLVGYHCGSERCIDVGHWADGSSRNPFKLYSGNRSAAGIARAMLSGTRNKPRRGQIEGDLETFGLGALRDQQPIRLAEIPFDVITPVGGSFNFDPRGAWTGIDAGYSPNDQHHGLDSSPVVEILAAIGLEHTRPDEFEKRRVRYAAWGCLLPPLLARPALAGVGLGFPTRVFTFELALSGKNKVVTFAEEEARE